MDKKTVHLKEPIDFGSEKITELHFRKPRAKDLRVMKGKGGMGDILDLAAAICDQPPAVVDMLSVEDALEVVQVVGVFMNVGPETGKRS